MLPLIRLAGTHPVRWKTLKSHRNPGNQVLTPGNWATIKVSVYTKNSDKNQMEMMHFTCDKKILRSSGVKSRGCYLILKNKPLCASNENTKLVRSHLKVAFTLFLNLSQWFSTWFNLLMKWLLNLIQELNEHTELL